jgi:hypothetical protein
MFRVGSTLQQGLVQLIPSSLRQKRFLHLEMSKEKCLKCVLDISRRCNIFG